jgi:predicted glycogen debranching enzyme
MDPLRIGRDRTGDIGAASRLEWLVTNGIGGYAAGTLGGALTRRYHGLLIASLKPPVARTFMLAKLAERIQVGGEWVDLDVNHWADGSVAPAGHLHLESFALEGSIPCWTYAIGDTRIEKRVWMEHGENTTYIQYRVASAQAPVTLALKALTGWRDHHETQAAGEGAAAIDAVAGGVSIQMNAQAKKLWLFADGATFTSVNEWYRAFALAVETERGLDDHEDLLYAVSLTRTLAAGEALTVVASTREDAVASGSAGTLALAAALPRRRSHERALLDAHARAHGKLAKSAPEWIQRLVLAADAFVVERAAADGTRHSGPDARRSVLAGYPWFTDWGRDTMIALPGLTLTTGRPELARAVIKLFAAHVDRGMLPNYFPDSGEPAEYNTVDAALWCFQAVRAYVDATRDTSLLAEVWPQLESILAGYREGTRYNIVVDPADGLVTQGADGVALTWMDARVDDWVATPRRGKPVEINALWYNAHTAMAALAPLAQRDYAPFAEQAARIASSFARFWNEPARALYDVLDGPAGDDASIRPNMIFAVSLPDSPLPQPKRRAVVDAVGRGLLTSHGLRSLDARDPQYRPHMVGERRVRDSAYHQGTVWTWLLPHHAMAHFRAYGDRDAALALLQPFEDLLQGMAIGTLPEVADGAEPHTPRGCFAQAWTVAETLRAWHTIAGAKARKPRTAAKRVASPAAASALGPGPAAS